MDDKSSNTPQSVKEARVRERWTRVYRRIQKKCSSVTENRDRLALDLMLDAFHPARRLDYRLAGDSLDEVMEQLGKMLRSVGGDTPDQMFVVACEVLERLEEWKAPVTEGRETS